MSLLSNCTSGGCGAKIGPGELGALLGALPVSRDPALLVGFGDSDDAAVYRLPGGDCIVSTADFFSPMVDDAYLFGKIAAANALSDVYAMGGRPLFALNLVCFPEREDKQLLARMLAGGAEKLAEAGASLAGGHSIYDREVKYGMAVTGVADPARLLQNNTPRAGDRLLLTKALGVGIVLAAHRGGLADPTHYDAACASMERLNKYAAESFGESDIHACTDVTGFGLLVHLSEMMGGVLSARIQAGSLPVLPGARQYADQYLLTAAGQRNRNHIQQAVAFGAADFASQELMLDPQTSGGLLLAVAPAHADTLLADIRRVQPEAALIGEVIPREGSAVVVV